MGQKMNCRRFLKKRFLHPDGYLFYEIHITHTPTPTPTLSHTHTPKKPETKETPLSLPPSLAPLSGRGLSPLHHHALSPAASQREEEKKKNHPAAAASCESLLSLLLTEICVI